MSKVLGLLRADGRADSRFDINLAEGKSAEKLVQDVLSGRYKVEVKQDFRVQDTGNILVEYAHNKGTKQTGISVTESDWYAFVLAGDGYDSELILFVETERLKRVLRKYGRQNKLSGKRGRSNFKLISLEDFFETS